MPCQTQESSFAGFVREVAARYCSLTYIKAALAALEAAFAGLFTEEAAAEGRETMLHSSQQLFSEVLRARRTPVVDINSATFVNSC